jgi:multidrug efflux pump subunit AcrB
MAIGLSSKSNTYTPLYLSNYAYTQIADSLKRIDGVGNVVIWGAQPYSMRACLNPDLMFSRGLTADDVVSAVQAQNIQVAPGSIGAEPAGPKTEFQWFFRLFNRTFDLGIAGYGAVVRRLLRVSGLVLVVYFGLLALTGLIFQKVPGGFIPSMDQGYLMVFAQLPDGASLQRTDDIRRQIEEIGQNIPGVKLTFAVEGLSILDTSV